MSEIKIQISGICGSGKTRVAYAIRDYLRSWGAQVEINDSSDGSPIVDMSLDIGRQLVVDIDTVTVVKEAPKMWRGDIDVSNVENT